MLTWSAGNQTTFETFWSKSKEKTNFEIIYKPNLGKSFIPSMSKPTLQKFAIFTLFFITVKIHPNEKNAIPWKKL